MFDFAIGFVVIMAAFTVLGLVAKLAAPYILDYLNE